MDSWTFVFSNGRRSAKAYTVQEAVAKIGKRAKNGTSFEVGHLVKVINRTNNQVSYWSGENFLEALG